jgi:rhodanese-related sulfurtransferase
MENPRKLKTATWLKLTIMTFCLLLSFAAAAADLVPFGDITPGQAAAMIAEKSVDPLFKIIDVRTAAEFAANRIKGALNIDVKADDFKDKVARLDRNGIYLVYCRGGVRSVRAMNLMKELGFVRVYNLAGGLKKWQEEKQPLETSPLPAATPAN